MGYRARFYLLSLLIAVAANAEKPVTYFPIDSWRTSSPREQNMDPEYLEAMHKAYDQRGQILIIKNGYLINSTKLIDSRDLEHLHSCTKSVISLLFGMVFGAEALQEPVIAWFPAYKRLDNSDVNMHHLLSMTSGMDWSDTPNIDSRQLLREKDWVYYILSKRISHQPGSAWNYNSGGSQLLSVILQKKLQIPLRNFVADNLFKPLGISRFTWWESNDGYLTAGWGLHLTVFDISKLGYLMLREDMWNGKRIVSSQWIRESTSRKAKVNKNFSYGYQWWIYDCLEYEAYKAYGNYGDHSVMIILIPALDIEVVLVGNFSNDIEILQRYVIPSALKGRHCYSGHLPIKDSASL